VGDRNPPLALFLTLYCSVFVAVYLYLVEPVFHEVMFALLGFVIIVLDLKLCVEGRDKMGISPKTFCVALFV
jgi:hypothetical protein